MKFPYMQGKITLYKIQFTSRNKLQLFFLWLSWKGINSKNKKRLSMKFECEIGNYFRFRNLLQEKIVNKI